MESTLHPVDMAAIHRAREKRQRDAVAAVDRLRRAHPEWWVWHSSNVGVEGYYARPKATDVPVLQADTAEGLDCAIAQAGSHRGTAGG